MQHSSVECCISLLYPFFLLLPTFFGFLNFWVFSSIFYMDFLSNILEIDIYFPFHYYDIDINQQFFMKGESYIWKAIIMMLLLQV